MLNIHSRLHLYSVHLTAGSDGSSSQQRKLRRKKREEKRLAGPSSKGPNGKQVDSDSSGNELDDPIKEFME